MSTLPLLPSGKKLVLGSQSPRRAQLLHEMGYDFRALAANADESHPSAWDGPTIATELALRKAETLREEIEAHEIILTADTVVWHGGRSLSKPTNVTEARQMLEKLSGSSHQVITGVCLLSHQRQKVFYDSVKVVFEILSPELIEHYIQEHQPYDKAGAYGIQEWLGMLGISRIEGSFFTVMGLPTHRVFRELRDF